MSGVLEHLIHKYPELQVCHSDIEDALNRIKSSYEGGGKLLCCGNGGSAADSEHIVGELMKGFMSKRPLPRSERELLEAACPGEGSWLAERLQGALPAVSLVAATSLWTAYANDVDPDMVFAQQVYGLGNRGDVLFGISTSGNSKNVIRALQVARAKGLTTIGLTGRSGGKMAGICDVTIRVPWDSTPDIQERHLPIYHAMCIELEEAFFPS
ncbi:D-sedoheptulose-7-phosphate isomerase [Paenibacillus gansuensis]|uniref:SIS domain-containing protein n=1 Tax=Paenibacillus gansuensis TaxID=306542 RepID=A0ABW5P9G6_9BACL